MISRALSQPMSNFPRYMSMYFFSIWCGECMALGAQNMKNGRSGSIEACEVRFAEGPSVAVYYANEEEVREGFLIALTAMGAHESSNSPSRQSLFEIKFVPGQGNGTRPAFHQKVYLEARPTRSGRWELGGTKAFRLFNRGSSAMSMR